MNNMNNYFAMPMGMYQMFNPNFQPGINNMANINMNMGMNQMGFNPNFQPGNNNMGNINNNINIPLGMNPFGYSMQPTNPNNDNKNGK